MACFFPHILWLTAFFKLLVMKKLIYTLFLITVCHAAYSQVPDFPMERPSSARVYGRIVDAATNRGIEAASVQLFKTRYDSASGTTRDSLIDGMLTQRNGDFDLSNVPLTGGLKLLATAIGYDIYEQPVSRDVLNRAGADKDLGNIRLNVDPKILQTVTVTATRPMMSLGIDRKVFNVEKNLASAGGTAEDVMRNVPSVSVDIDGNVTLRNSTPQIFVDGRPSSMTLEQIPADAIESVEIITNPSARFDASGGGAGILNIVLKKNRKTGYNGNLRAGIDQRGKTNLGANLNLREGKINAFLNINYRDRKSIANGRTERLTFLDTLDTQLFQTDRNVSERDNIFGRAGFDYLIDNRNTLTISGDLSRGSSNGNSVNNLTVDSLFTNSTSQSFSDRVSLSESNYRNKGVNIGYKHLFPKAGKEWTADINYNSSSNDNSNRINTSWYDQHGGPFTKTFNQLVQGTGTNEYLNFQTDYANPINDNSKLEFGGRVQIRSVDNQNIISYMLQPGVFTKIPQLSSDYINQERVYAGYASFSNKINRFGYQLGLRIESSDYSGRVNTVGFSEKDTVISYGNKFPFSLFPSVFLSHQLTDDQELQFNVTRRINRPNFWQLFPFTDYADSLNLSRGNPNLKPEFTYSAELAYQKNFGRSGTFLASAYFKYTDDLITRFQEKDVNPVSGKDNLINTYINANSSYIGGLEFIHRQTIYSWWEMTSNLNLYSSKINLANSGMTEQGNIYSWSADINNTFKLPKHFSFQLSGEYRSKTILPPGGGGRGGWGMPQATAQGYIRPQWEVDAAVRFDFLKDDRASITLNVSDIFRTDASNVYSESEFFKQNSWRLRDPQFFRLNFSWRFGKFDTSLFKRKNNREPGQQTQPDTMEE
jgi:outer membrane receptor protein involved in Fe transport